MKFLTLLILSLSLGSCSEYYFSEAQPIHSTNYYKVPKKLRGTWSLGEKNDSIIIGKNFFRQIVKNQFRESINEMELDSNIYFIDGKVYSDEKGGLEGGYNYTIKDDSIIVDRIEIKHVQFGEKAFLRKFEYGFILNTNHVKMPDWWNLKFVDTRGKDGVIIREIAKEDLERDKNHKILHDDFSHYIVAKWSKQDIRDFIDGGGFSDTIMILNYNEKLKN